MEPVQSDMTASVVAAQLVLMERTVKIDSIVSSMPVKVNHVRMVELVSPKLVDSFSASVHLVSPVKLAQSLLRAVLMWPVRGDYL